MRPILLWWRNLPPETKKQIMQFNSITAITYHGIKTVYAERGK